MTSSLAGNRGDETYDAFRTAAWNREWVAPAPFMAAQLDCPVQPWRAALENLDVALLADPQHLQCLDLRALVLLELGRAGESTALLAGTLAIDPLDWWAVDASANTLTCNSATCMDAAATYADGGFHARARSVLDRAAAVAATVRHSGTGALIWYWRQAILTRLGVTSADAEIRSTRFCFPWLLVDHDALLSLLALAEESMTEGARDTAVRLVVEAMSPPASLRAVRHPLKNSSPLWLTLGDALAGAGREDPARQAWQKDASGIGEFRDRAGDRFGEAILFSVMACRRVGLDGRPGSLVAGLHKSTTKLAATEARIDYFATSLPRLVLFAENLHEAKQRRVAVLDSEVQWYRGENAAIDRLDDLLVADPKRAFDPRPEAVASSGEYDEAIRRSAPERFRRRAEVRGPREGETPAMAARTQASAPPSPRLARPKGGQLWWKRASSLNHLRSFWPLNVGQ